MKIQKAAHYSNVERGIKAICVLFVILLFVLAGMTIEAQAVPGEKNKYNKGVYKAGELLVKFKKDVKENKKKRIHAKRKATSIKELKRTGVSLVRLDPDMSVEEAKALYTADPNVVYAEPNYIVHAVDVTPEDARFDELWGLENTGQTGGTPGADIDALGAWETTTGETGETGNPQVVIGVIDTGIDYSHEDLSPNMWVNEVELNGVSGVDDDGNGYIDDIHGINAITGSGDPMDDQSHGTHCAGTIGAVGDNTIGVTGVNWHVKLVACKFLDAYGSGYASDAIECLEYIQALKEESSVNVIATSNSWGGTSFSQSMYDAIQNHLTSDILFIAAAGNYNRDNDLYSFYPANYDLPNLIAVAATDHNDARATFSNYGKNSVHVGAPGVNILSTIPGEDQDGEDQYAKKSGTSMATPHVAGLSALLKSDDPVMDWFSIKNLILSGGVPIGSLNDNTISGRRISAFGSLNCNEITNENRVFSVLQYPNPIIVGEPATIEVLSINCETPVEPVSMSSCGNEIVELQDMGIPPDIYAGDGIFSTTWTPEGGLGEIILSSPAGEESIFLNFTVEFTTITPPTAADLGLPVTMIAEVTGVCPTDNVQFQFELEYPDGSGQIICPKQVSQTCEWMTGGFPPGTYTLEVIAFVEVEGHVDEIRGSAVYELLTDKSVFNITDVIVQEDQGPAVFTVSLLRADSGSISVDFATSAGSASAGLDYLTSNGTLVFAPGETEKNIVVTILNDSTGEGYETFFVTLSNPTGDALISDGIGVGTIEDEYSTGYKDLIVTEAILPITIASWPQSGVIESISLTNTVKNIGEGATESFYVGFYLSTDATITPDDTYLGKRYVGVLPGGGESTAETTIVPPYNFPNGDYFIGVYADIYNKVQEFNEVNNSLEAGSLLLTIDITMNEVSGLMTNPGIIAITDTVKNLGGPTAGFYVALYLSKDSTITTSDIYLGRRYISNLAGGAESTVTTSIPVPVNLTSGTYYLGARADIYNKVQEANETNNSLSGNQIIVNTDLEATAISGPASGNPGGVISMSNTVRNAGGATAGFYVGMYLSTDSTITTGDIYMGRRYVSMLAGGKESTATTMAALPANLVSGTYYLGIIADIYNRVPESNEGNNQLAGNQIAISHLDFPGACSNPIRNDSTLEIFSTVQAAVDDPNAVDYDTIQITAADFAEDVLYDQNAILTLSGGYACNFSDNPSMSTINSLTITDGTVIVENIILQSNL